MLRSTITYFVASSKLFKIIWVTMEGFMKRLRYFTYKALCSTVILNQKTTSSFLIYVLYKGLFKTPNNWSWIKPFQGKI